MPGRRAVSNWTWATPGRFKGVEYPVPDVLAHALHWMPARNCIEYCGSTVDTRKRMAVRTKAASKSRKPAR